MFDFENLTVYSKAKVQHNSILNFLKLNSTIDGNLKNQFKRSTSSIVLNIAEGSGRFTKADKRYFYIMARGSVYECVAILDLLREEGKITGHVFQLHYAAFEELSKMLLALINSQK